MWHQVFPKGHFGGPVVVTNPRLQTNVQVQLIVGVILGPGHLLKTVGLSVDELGVLWNRLVWITADTSKTTVTNLNQTNKTNVTNIMKCTKRLSAVQ